MLSRLGRILFVFKLVHFVNLLSVLQQDEHGGEEQQSLFLSSEFRAGRSEAEKNGKVLPAVLLDFGFTPRSRQHFQSALNISVILYYNVKRFTRLCYELVMFKNW